MLQALPRKLQQAPWRFISVSMDVAVASMDVLEAFRGSSVNSHESIHELPFSIKHCKRPPSPDHT